jgi:hypothetical protein
MISLTIRKPDACSATLLTAAVGHWLDQCNRHWARSGRTRPRTYGLSRTCPCWASCRGESWQVTSALSRSAGVRGGLAFTPDAISHLRLCTLGW